MNRALQSWAPPFCPNPKCRFHRGDTALWRYVKIGFYSRKTPPYKVQRLRCDACRRRFATQRETIAYSKRRACAAERLAIFLVWRNWMRPYSIRKRGKTPAMRLSLIDHKVGVDNLLDRRYFPSRIELPTRWREYYAKTVKTRAIPKGRKHGLKYAA